MDNTAYKLPDTYDSLDELVMQLTTLIGAFNRDVDAVCSFMIELLDESDPAFIQFEQLPAAGISSIKKISEAFERSSSTHDEDDSKIKEEFWRFLMHQLRVRADALKASSLALEMPGSCDCNSSLKDQTRELAELSKLIDECQEWQANPESTEPNSTNEIKTVANEAVPSMVA